MDFSLYSKFLKNNIDPLLQFTKLDFSKYNRNLMNRTNSLEQLHEHIQHEACKSSQGHRIYIMKISIFLTKKT